MYSVDQFGIMMTDRRAVGFLEALRRTVHKGSVVVDIGTGTGVWALAAWRLGARRVFAIEPQPCIQVARELAAANGCADRIEFIEDLSTRIDLPERADVIVSDMSGNLPFYTQNLSSVADARRRFLKPDGILIPARDTVFAAPVEAAKFYEELTGPWDRDSLQLGLDMSPGRRYAVNTRYQLNVEREQLMGDSRAIVELDYATLEDVLHDVRASWTASRDGVVHGFSIWFNRIFVDDIGFDNSPGQPKMIYGRAFLPLSCARTVQAGDRIEVRLEISPVRGDYLLRWDSAFFDREANHRVAQFKQSTFYAGPISLAAIAKKSATYRPVLDGKGAADRFVLGLMDGSHTLDQITERVIEQFPEAFRNRDDAFGRVAELSGHYSR